MKYNIAAVSPAGATIEFRDVDQLKWERTESGGIHEVYEDSRLVGLIPASWAVHLQRYDETAAPPFVPVNVTPFKPQS